MGHCDQMPGTCLAVLWQLWSDARNLFTSTACQLQPCADHPRGCRTQHDVRSTLRWASPTRFPSSCVTHF